MAHGTDFVEGWPAVAWVAGTGVGLLLTAGVLWLRSRSLRGRRAALASYRTEETIASQDAQSARALAVLMVTLCVASQLLYVGLYVELVRWLLGAHEPPRIVFGLFFWVLLVCATSAGGALYTGWKGPH